MSKILEQSTQAINTWNDIRNNAVAVNNYFNQGAYFQIHKKDYVLWNSNAPKNLHAYMGLVSVEGQPNFSLSLFCVDSVTDQLPVESNRELFNEYTKKSIYQRSVLPNPNFYFSNDPLAPSNPEIDPTEALTRTEQWNLHKEAWLFKQTDTVQVFVIPFEDLQVLFKHSAVESIIVLPGLKKIPPNIFTIDLLLWGYSDSRGIQGNYPTDLVRLASPYKNPAAFQLLNYAL